MAARLATEHGELACTEMTGFDEGLDIVYTPTATQAHRDLKSHARHDVTSPRIGVFVHATPSGLSYWRKSLEERIFLNSATSPYGASTP
jgi:hypothetical protein